MAATRDRVTGLCHAGMCVALGVALALLLGADGSQEPAVPPGLDAAAQRLRIGDELASLNGKMDELLQLLRSGNVKVVCLPADTVGRGPEHARTGGTISIQSACTAPAGGLAR